MRPVIKRAMQSLEAPEDPVLAEARRAPVTSAEHDRLLRTIEAFHAIEAVPALQPVPWPDRLRVAAFNAERMKNPAATRGLVERAGADVSLFCEVDIGMARSGNVHGIRELIGASGEGYLYGVEFVELDLGNAEEMRRHAGERNACGLHGNAVVSRLGLEDPHLIPLEEGGLWFSGFHGAQRRIGNRIALAARLAGAPRPLWVVSVHLESKTNPADRRAQVRNLLNALRFLAPNEACIIGGDFNTKALPRGEDERRLLLDCPERYEPLFAELRSAGFDWGQVNLACPTQRAGPSGKHTPPFGKLDWLVARGIAAENPQVVPAVDEEGRAISDHEMIVADFRFR